MIEVTRSKNDLFPILADLCSYGVRGPQKRIWGHQGQNLRSPTSKKDLVIILADLSSYGVQGSQKRIWGHQGQNLRSQGPKMTFSQFWLIRAPMRFRGLESLPEVTNVNT